MGYHSWDTENKIRATQWAIASKVQCVENQSASPNYVLS